MINEERVIIPNEQIRRYIIQQLINESVGYGPLEELLKDDSITEIMVNGPMKCSSKEMGSSNNRVCALIMKNISDILLIELLLL